ncbi:MAG: cytochrome C oxidase subunit IV family protein [Ilumatobacteraceae bacterium]
MSITDHPDATHLDATPVAGSGDGSGDGGRHDEHDEHGLTDKGYVVIAALLGAMTAAEVALSYLDLPGWFFMTALLTLMVTKFLTVVSFFMHLRFDNKLFSWLFYAGLSLAVFVYIAALCTFQFFATG